MPPPSSPISSPLPAEPSIARSRSRYKGPRSYKTHTNLSKPPSFSAEQLQRLHNVALSPNEPRPQDDVKDRRELEVRPPRRESMHRHRDSADDFQKSGTFYAQKGSPRGAKNRTDLQDVLVCPSQAPHGYRKGSPRRRSFGETEPHKERGHDATPSQKALKSPHESSRNPRPELPFSHKEELAATIVSPALLKGGLTERVAGPSNGKRLRKHREELKRTISSPIALEPPQNIAKPAFDAPVSAVNAGERRVNVKYDQNLTSLPVTPSTTPTEIIRSAVDLLAVSLDPNRLILLESFKQLGLERPLRRYEHVRKVLNSWDNDGQNTLVIRPTPVGGRNDLLNLRSASVYQPVDTSVYIHYSQRPGRWDRRWVTLRSDGQMLIAKREGGESVNICHMSDFDIYILTARESAKRIRPPRKICFAVKSQQKSSMFLSTANFVHFFSTSDPILAATWYEAVLEWRSWYLVNVMGEGEADSHVIGHSVDDMPLHSPTKSQTLVPKELIKDAGLDTSRKHDASFVQVSRPEEPGPFAPTGLLGRTYTQRQKAQREREKAQNAGPDQPAATPNVNPVHGLNRMQSQHSKPKPLNDLTPQHREQLQHARKGRGIIIGQIPAGGLVKVANTPEAAVPPSTVGRRPTSWGRDELSIGRSKTVRRDHRNGALSEPKQTSISPEKGAMAFTGGLLASNSRGQGDAQTGRGVMTGDRQAKEPMLHVEREPQYAPGSLLEHVERQDEGFHPVVNKKKNGAMIADVGEAT